MGHANFLSTLPQNQSVAERDFLIGFYNSMPAFTRMKVDEAARIAAASAETVQQSIGMIDHTSLNTGAVPMTGAESDDEIAALCNAARGQDGVHTAAICVYPNHIPVALQALAVSGVSLAVVNNFPHGDQAADHAAASAASAAAAGAQEIDTVIDYAALLRGERDAVLDKLVATREAAHAGGARLKIILVGTAYPAYDELYDAAMIALSALGKPAKGRAPDFVKTCTGKGVKPGFGAGTEDASNLAMSAAVLQAVADSGRVDVGVKISGGVKTAIDCERIRFLVETLRGPAFYTPDRFRIGASSLLGNLTARPGAAPRTGTAYAPKFDY